MYLGSSHLITGKAHQSRRWRLGETETVHQSRHAIKVKRRMTDWNPIKILTRSGQNSSQTISRKNLDSLFIEVAGLHLIFFFINSNMILSFTECFNFTYVSSKTASFFKSTTYLKKKAIIWHCHLIIENCLLSLLWRRISFQASVSDAWDIEEPLTPITVSNLAWILPSPLNFPINPISVCYST